MRYIGEIKAIFEGVDLESDAIKAKAKEIQKKLEPEIPDEKADELMRLYAHLALTNGERTTNEDVHNAWAYWTLVDRDNPTHKSMVPFDELDEATQEMDTPYRDAIREVAVEKSSSMRYDNPMTQIPEDFQELVLPRLAAEKEPEDEPVYFLWVYDPHEDKVHVEHNEGRHAAEHVDHSHLADRVPHPERVHGFAYRIRGGYRITDWEHRPVDDPHVLEAVRLALKGEKKPNDGSRAQARAQS